ncbi:MAG TPA: hypothetical protein VHE30_21145 [Polyangiaceae bacterium]|nr:hypothetical protein [Polyangiaceae bacterium]
MGCSAGGGSSDDQPTTPSNGGGFGVGGFGTGGALGGTGGSGVGTGGTSGDGGSPGAGGDSSAGGAVNLGSGGSGNTGGYPYDTTVQFDWPEAKATAGSCKPGHYSGTFTGLYVADIVAFFPVPIAGNVDLTLEQSQDGEFYKLADGKVSGLVYGFIPFSSGLTGTLNCTTAKLENGYMPNGKYTIGTTDYPYEGPLHADYDKLTNQFVNGKWRVGEPTWKEGDPDPQFGGYGDWTVSYTGP